jgi:pyruvate ferredoxin oxidoreductase gamma subunit
VGIVPATELAVRHVGRPVPNAALLGGLCAVTGMLALGSVEAAIRQKFKAEVAERNIAAAREAHQMVLASLAVKGGRPHAQAV